MRSAGFPPGSKSLRSVLYRGKLYIRNKDGREELYDIETDPAESHELIKTANALPWLKRFRNKMYQIDREVLEAEARRNP
jgi:hypothetical protein